MQFPYPVTLPTKLSGNFHTPKIRRDKPKVQYPIHPNSVAEQSLRFPSRKTAPTNILFRYLYRDASNYKQYGEAIFSNHTFLPLDEIKRQIRACLQDGQFFIPRQVNLEERFFETLYEDDHPWHEFEEVEVTTLAPFDPGYWAHNQHRRDITEFITNLEQACKAGWDELDVRVDVKYLLDEQKAELRRNLEQ